MNKCLVDCCISSRPQHRVIQPKIWMYQGSYRKLYIIALVIWNVCLEYFFQHSLCHVVEALIDIYFCGSLINCLSEGVFRTNHDGPPN